MFLVKVPTMSLHLDPIPPALHTCFMTREGLPENVQGHCMYKAVARCVVGVIRDQL